MDLYTAKVKTGDEPLVSNEKTLDYTLLDFWRWSVSDILSNAIRGRLAEFIVATTLKLNLLNIRAEWDAYDLLTPDGIKIEVKSAGYLQSWSQKEFSKVKFSTKAARAWNFEIDKREIDTRRHADIYIFCLLKHQNKESVNPLNMDQWEFYVLSTIKLDIYLKSQATISLSALQKLREPIKYEGLADEVSLVYNESRLY